MHSSKLDETPPAANQPATSIGTITMIETTSSTLRWSWPSVKKRRGIVPLKWNRATELVAYYTARASTMHGYAYNQLFINRTHSHSVYKQLVICISVHRACS